MTEWTSSDPLGADQTSVTDGIGGIVTTSSGSFAAGATVQPIAAAAGSLKPIVGNARQKMIQGVDMRGVAADASGLTGFGVVPSGSSITALTVHSTVASTNPTRRYQVQLSLGMLLQDKLIPTKFMASQLSIELTLANPQDCIYVNPANSTGSASLLKDPTYTVTNMNLIPEILEFDASYDESFLKGLQTTGVPIKFSTWNNFRFSTAKSNSFNLQIQERSRSVKAIFAMQRRSQPTLYTDSGASFFNTDTTTVNAASTLQDFQFRIGGRYFPASPVQCSLEGGSSIPNGGAEAYVELAKAINILGNNQLSTSVNAVKWALNPARINYVGGAHTLLQEYDYDYSLVGFKQSGAPVVSRPGGVTAGGSSSAAGDMPSACFAMAIDLETSNGLEISGLNAEEQSDISLIARFSGNQGDGTGAGLFLDAATEAANPQTPFKTLDNTMIFDVFTYIDSMIVLRENNVILYLKIGSRINTIVNCMKRIING